MLAVPGNVVVPPNSAVMTGGSCESLGSLGYDSTVEDAQCPYPREKDTTGTAVQEEPAKKPPCMDSHDKSPKKLGSGGTSESPEKDTPGRHSQATEKDSPGEPAQKPPKMHSHDKGLKKLVLARQKLKELLKAHGNFKALELQIRKSNVASYSKSKGGKWVTKNYLTTAEHWTPPRTQQ
eukprot:s2682_g7.t1